MRKLYVGATFSAMYSIYHGKEPHTVAVIGLVVANSFGCSGCAVFFYSCLGK